MKKPHPLKGRKVSKETIAKRLATLAANRAGRNTEEEPKPKRKYTKRAVRKSLHFDTRSLDQLKRDMNEALWCLDQAVARTRRKIASGELSLSEVTDEETFLYMAKRYLEGGLKP
jgi:hypothetical protein